MEETSSPIIFDPIELLDDSSNILIQEGTNPTFKFKSNKNVTWEFDDYGDYKHFIIDSQTGEITFSKIPDFENPLNTKGTIISVKLNLNSESKFFIELFDYEDPEIHKTSITAENFLQYVLDDSYQNSFFHRAVNGFVLQGGGFYLYEDEENNFYWSEVESKGTIKNESGNSNKKGTIAMAKVGGNPDSATSQWFINLDDNSNNLDNQNGGFTVFGRIIGDGMEVIDKLQIKGLNMYEYFELGYYLIEPVTDPSLTLDVLIGTYPNNSIFANLPLWERVNIGEVSINDFVLIENIGVVEEGKTIESYEYKLKVKAIDENGIITKHQLNISISDKDEIAPDAPTSLEISSFNTNNQTPTITGNAEADTTITLLNGNVVLGTATADSKGSFSITPSFALEDGTYPLTAIATDSAGNTSSKSSSISITIDAEDVVTELDESTKTTSDPVEDIISEPYQTISASIDEVRFTPGEDVSIDLLYTTSNIENELSGLGLKVHYNSFLFSPSGDNGGVTSSLNTIAKPSINDDTDNLDNDVNTDKYIAISWVDFASKFPGEELPATIANLKFSSLKEGVDSLTGDSKINFTSSAPSENYDFLGTSITLKPQIFNLDLDGNGKVSALGDGLMVIRKLFGAAFNDKKLTFKAISDEATRTSQEIHDFIQAAIDDKTLDVDGDGSVTALGDGLMVIRKLFGAAFHGDKLTEKAMSNDATRTTDEIHEYINDIYEINSMI